MATTFAPSPIAPTLLILEDVWSAGLSAALLVAVVAIVAAVVVARKKDGGDPKRPTFRKILFSWHGLLALVVTQLLGNVAAAAASLRDPHPFAMLLMMPGIGIMILLMAVQIVPDAGLSQATQDLIAGVCTGVFWLLAYVTAATLWKRRRRP